MMSDYIKKSEADLLNEKERKIKKQKEDKEYFKWKKEKEANKNVPLFDNPAMSELEMSAVMNENSNLKFEARLAREQEEEEKRKKEVIYLYFLHNIHYRTYYIRIIILELNLI